MNRADQERLMAIDFRHQTWFAVEAQIESHLAKERECLESALDFNTTQECRGAIRALKTLLNLPEERKRLIERGRASGSG